MLPDWMIWQWAADGGVNPFDETCINPCSIDLKLGNEFIDLENDRRFTADSITIEIGQAILATTVEHIKMPAWAAGVVYLKSSLARAGLDHALAGFVDAGFEGTLTMEFHAHRSITLFASERVIQLVLHKLEAEPDKLYSGRYQGQRGPTGAREP